MKAAVGSVEEDIVAMCTKRREQAFRPRAPGRGARRAPSPRNLIILRRRIHRRSLMILLRDGLTRAGFDGLRGRGRFTKFARGLGAGE